MYIPLYEINAKLAQAFDEETGELLIPEEELDEIFQAEKNGVDYFIGLYKNASATATAYETEAKAQAKRAKSYQRIADYAFSRLEQHMEGNNYESTVGKISFRESTRCENTDYVAFMKWKDHVQYGVPDFKPDKKAIADAIKAGTEVPGWELTKHKNMNIK